MVVPIGLGERYIKIVERVWVGFSVLVIWGTRYFLKSTNWYLLGDSAVPICRAVFCIDFLLDFCNVFAGIVSFFFFVFTSETSLM